ncbi:hypothetical protein HRbin39_01901 [bacterium HR39]|nr:hypothetical protein HRbin39_01901 [bacterium HR39]
MSERKLRTAWRVRQRYRRLWRAAAAAGFVLSTLWVAWDWTETFAAHALGPRRMVTGVALIALATWLPYALVRARWQQVKIRHYAEWGL